MSNIMHLQKHMCMSPVLDKSSALHTANQIHPKYETEEYTPRTATYVSWFGQATHPSPMPIIIFWPLSWPPPGKVLNLLKNCTFLSAWIFSQSYIAQHFVNVWYALFK